MKRTLEEEPIGTCKYAMGENIRFEKEDADSIDHKYPRDIIRNQYCRVPDSPFSLDMMRDLRIKELPCRRDNDSEVCPFNIE